VHIASATGWIGAGDVIATVIAAWLDSEPQVI